MRVRPKHFPLNSVEYHVPFLQISGEELESTIAHYSSLVHTLTHPNLFRVRGKVKKKKLPNPDTAKFDL